MATLQPSGCLLKDVVSLELMFQLLLNCFFTIHYSLGRFHNNFTDQFTFQWIAQN